MIRQSIILILVATALALLVNLVSPNAIPLVGQYRELSSGDDPIVPPDVMEGDPPFIAVGLASVELQGRTALFVDARDPSEFECGTIPGSVNLPFDYLPEEGIAAYVDSVLGGVAVDRRLILFCSGEECDLSLHLGRNLQELGYTDAAIFFGGWREWEKFEFEVERRVNCEE